MEAIRMTAKRFSKFEAFQFFLVPTKVLIAFHLFFLLICVVNQYICVVA